MVSRTATISKTDYYEVLGVSPDASLDEIRAVFKRQVLETHPDKNPERREWSERRIRELIAAYEIIGDSVRREEFDRQHRAWRRATGRVVRKEQPFFFRKRDPEARALLVLHHLCRFSL